MRIAGSCKTKMTAAALSSMLVLSMASPALAATTGDGKTDVNDATQTITSLQQGDTVSAWRIADAYIDSSTNEVKYDMASGLPEAYDSIDEIRAIGSGTAETAANAILAELSSTPANVTATASETGEATLTLDSGYYLVTVTSTSGKTVLYQNMLVDASPDVDGTRYVTRTLDNITVKKSDVTAPSKTIANGDTTAEKSDGYSVGDTVNFKIAGAIPSYPSNATHATYSVTDSPASGLAIDTNTIAVKSGGTTLEAGPDKAYTVTKNKDGGFTIAFANPVALAGQAYTIEYSATVNSVDAKDGTVANNEHATFNPNPYIDSTVDTPDDQTTVKTYGLVFKKIASDTHQGLAGAEFQVKDGNKVVGTATSDENGYVSLAGLKAGTYTVTETKVPAGYQKVADFPIELSSTTAAGDNPATTDITETNYNYYSKDSGVVDAKQGALPTTGGAGTVALTAAGVVLVAGAAGFIVMSRRRSNDN